MRLGLAQRNVVLSTLKQSFTSQTPYCLRWKQPYISLSRLRAGHHITYGENIRQERQSHVPQFLARRVRSR
jgi:hypothetical protein